MPVTEDLARRPVRSPTNNQVRRVEQKREANALGFKESWGVARSLDSPAVAFGDMLTRENPEANPDFRASKDDWQKATEGIPPEMQDRLHDAKSRDELFQQAGRLRTEMEAEKRLASAGWSGMTARIGASLFDESMLASMVLTEGAATPWILASKASRITRAVRAGLVGAADGAAMQSFVSSQRETQGLQDVLIAGATGAALGAPFGAISKPVGKAARNVDDDVIQGSANSVRREVQGEQIEELRAKAANDAETRALYENELEDLENLRTQRADIDTQIRDVDEELSAMRARDPVDELIASKPKRVSKAKRAVAKSHPDVGSFMRSLNELPEDATRARQAEELYRRLTPESSRNRVGKKKAYDIKAGADREMETVRRQFDSQLRDVEARSASLRSQADDLDEQIETKQAGILNMETSASLERTDAVGADTVSGTAVPASPVGEGAFPARWYGVEKPPASAVRFSGTAMLKGQERSQTLRGWADSMGADGMGPRKYAEGENTGETATYSAAEDQDRIFFKHQVAYQRVNLRARKDWMREQGHGWAERNRERAIHDFEQRVTRAVETGQSDDPNVQRAASAAKKAMRDMLRELKAAGVQGFEEIAEDSTYMTRTWKANKVVTLNRDPNVGPKAIKQALYRGIKSRNPDVEDDVAQAMSDAVFSRFLRQGHGLDTEFTRALFSRDLDLLRTTLDDADIDNDVAERLIESLRKREGTEESGKNPQAKQRIEMDIYAEVDLPNGGKLRPVDLMEDDAEHVVTNYLRKMSGQVAVARRLRKDGVEGPINPDTYTERVLEHARAEGANDADINRARMMFNMIMGRPPEEGSNASWKQVTRFVKGWNFVRLMGQVGFAQVAEMGPIVGQLGWGTVAARLPRMKAMLKRMEDGTIEDGLLSEMEDYIGAFGAERMIHQPRAHIDDYQLELQGFGERSREAFQYADTALSKTQRLVGDVSGIAGTTIFMQRLAGTGIAQKMYRLSLNPSKANKARLRSFGLSDDMQDRVFAQLKKYGTDDDGNLGVKKIGRHNFDRWDDTEARDAYAGLVHKWAYTMVQRNFTGELPMFLETELGGLLGQFRTFMAAAWEKQTLRNVAQHDIEAVNLMLASSFFGGLSYSVQQYLNSIGREDRDRYIRERLNPVEIGKASFQRGGYASLIPGFIDTALTTPGIIDRPVWAYGRTTGLANSFIAGVPAVQLTQDISGAARSLAAPFRSDYDYSQQDFKSAWGLMALQNAMLFRQAGNMLSEGLPRESVQTPKTFEDLMDDF